jgi:hypothetical protein
LCGTETAPNRSTKNQQPTGEFGEFLERHIFLIGLFHQVGLCKKRQNPANIQKVLLLDTLSRFETERKKNG